MHATSHISHMVGIKPMSVFRSIWNKHTINRQFWYVERSDIGRKQTYSVACNESKPWLAMVSRSTCAVGSANGRAGPQNNLPYRGGEGTACIYLVWVTKGFLQPLKLISQLICPWWMVSIRYPGWMTIAANWSPSNNNRTHRKRDDTKCFNDLIYGQGTVCREARCNS